MRLLLPMSLAAALSLGIPMSAYGQAFPLEFCGDPPDQSLSTWYPVYVTHLSLQRAQEQFCRDAFSTYQGPREVIQLGSFSDRQRAAIFADRVGGVVGDPYRWGTASASPSGSLGCQPGTEYVVEAGDGVANLRSGPSTEVDVLSQLPNGNRVQVRAQVTNADNQIWCELAAPQQGWIFSGLLRRAGENTARQSVELRDPGPSPAPMTVQAPSSSIAPPSPAMPEEQCPFDDPAWSQFCEKMENFYGNLAVRHEDSQSVQSPQPATISQWENASEADILDAYLEEFRLASERRGIPLGRYRQTTQMEDASYLCITTETVEEMHEFTRDAVQSRSESISTLNEQGIYVTLLTGEPLPSPAQVSSRQWSVFDATVLMEESTHGRFCQAVTRRWRPWEVFGTRLDPECIRGCWPQQIPE
jgi:hypothetical protein